MNGRIGCRAGLALLALGALALAQRTSETVSSRRPEKLEGSTTAPTSRAFRVTSTQVLIPVGVRDKKGRVIEGLTAEDFEIFDNGVRQTVIQCTLEKGVRDTVIVFDQSESMRPEIAVVNQAVRTFVKEAAAGDKISVIAVRDSAGVNVAPTRDTDRVLSELGPVVAEGRTALFDGVYLGLDRLLKARAAQSAVLILSDGGDNSSRYHARDLRNIAIEAGATIHSIVTSPPGFPLSPESQGQATMKLLAEETGGWFWAAKGKSEIASLVARLQSDPHYVLAYTPTDVPLDGRHHRVSIKVKRAGGLRLTWRRSYVNE